MDFAEGKIRRDCLRRAGVIAPYGMRPFKPPLTGEVARHSRDGEVLCCNYQHYIVLQFYHSIFLEYAEMNQSYEKMRITFDSTIFGCLIWENGVKYMLEIYKNRLFRHKKVERIFI